MITNSTMDAMDAVYGSLAECFITIRGKRYNFMQMTDFESDAEINLVEVAILGRTTKGHKPGGMNITWSATAHYNQSIMRELAIEFQDKGIMPVFDIQVTNEDPTSQVGRQTIIHRNCLCDKLVLAKFAAGEEILSEDLSGTCERVEMPEKFKTLPGMLA